MRLMQPSLVPLYQERPAWERMDWPEDCLVQAGSQLRLHGTLRGLQTHAPHLSEKATEAFEGEEICSESNQESVKTDGCF